MRKTILFTLLIISLLVLAGCANNYGTGAAVAGKKGGQGGGGILPNGCPKLSQASLDLDTPGCPTDPVGLAACEDRTHWLLEKDADQNQLTLGLNDVGQISYTVKVTEGETERILFLEGFLVITNSGEQTTFLSNVVANLQLDPDTGKPFTILSATETASELCAEQGGDAETCFGAFFNSPSATLTIFDPLDNDEAAKLGDIPIPPTEIDNDGDGVINEDPVDFQEIPIDNDGDGFFNEDPRDGIDNDGDGNVDEDPIDFDTVPIDNDGDGFFNEDGPDGCNNAVVLRFEAEFDVGAALQPIGPGDAMRLELLATFVGAGGRGKSKDSTSCTLDINCNGVIDPDDPETCLLDESEDDNVRTVKQRESFIFPECGPVCDNPRLTDPGAFSLDPGCAEAATNILDVFLPMVGEGNMIFNAIEGAVGCTNGACATSIQNIAELTCERPELIEGSPAGDSIDILCEDDGGGGEEPCISPGVACSFTIGGWGTRCSGNNPGCFRDRGFAAVFPAGVGIGENVVCDLGLCGQNVLLNGPVLFGALWLTSLDVENFLPDGGPSGPLTADLVNPVSTSGGTLVSQLLAATLAVSYDDAGKFDIDPIFNKDDPSIKTGDLIFEGGTPCDGLTLREVLTLAHQFIAGGPSVLTASQFNTCLTIFNEAFVECEVADDAHFECPPGGGEDCKSFAGDASFVAFLDADDVVLPTVFDIVGFNDLTLIGTATTGPGYIGDAVVLNGGGEGIMFDITDGQRAFTVDMWVLFDRVDVDGFIAGDWPNGWLLFQRGGTLHFYVRGASGNMFLEFKGAVAPGTWYHIAATYDGFGDAKLYLDGVEIGTAAGTGTVNAGSPTTHIGHSGFGGHAFFLGAIDEVNFFTRALAAQEVLDIFNAGTDGKCKEDQPPGECVPAPTGTTMWHTFDFAPPTDLIDGSVGTLVGGAAIGPGLVGNALHCNTGFADLSAELPALDVASIKYVDMWIKPVNNFQKQVVKSIQSSFGPALAQIVVEPENTLPSGFGNGIQFSITRSDGTNAYTGLISTPDIFDGEWHHVAWVLTAGRPTFYYDGFEAAPTFPTANDLTADFSDLGFVDTILDCKRAPHPIFEGELPMINGMIDEQQAGNIPLTAQQVFEIFAAGPNGKCK